MCVRTCVRERLIGRFPIGTGPYGVQYGTICMDVPYGTVQPLVGGHGALMRAKATPRDQIGETDEHERERRSGRPQLCAGLRVMGSGGATLMYASHIDLNAGLLHSTVHHHISACRVLMPRQRAAEHSSVAHRRVGVSVHGAMRSPRPPRSGDKRASGQQRGGNGGSGGDYSCPRPAGRRFCA